jgi:hypothetical protein
VSCAITAYTSCEYIYVITSASIKCAHERGSLLNHILTAAAAAAGAAAAAAVL